MRGSRMLLTVASTVATLLLVASPAAALSSPTPWDGANPFRCTVQDAKFGATVPHPDADPFCVHFTKTDQNITALGIVPFLLEEPARTALAVPKCFYFQEDHWRSSVVQDDTSTVIYEWVGHYFFDKATGDGGVWVTDFAINGKTADPTSMPGFPPSYGSDFGPGTGGFITHNAFAADPTCAAKAAANAAAIYARYGQRPHCLSGSRRITSHALGPIFLGERERRLGPPRDVHRGFLHFCVAGGGEVLAGEAADRSGTLGANPNAPMLVLLTSSRRFVLHGRRGRPVSVASTRRNVRAALRRPRRIGRVGSVPVWRAGNAFVELRHGRVSALGIFDTRRIRTNRALLRFLARAG